MSIFNSISVKTFPKGLFERHCNYNLFKMKPKYSLSKVKAPTN